MSLKNTNPASENGKFLNVWAVIAIVLIAIIVTACVIICLKFNINRGVEISVDSRPVIIGQINIRGEINNPGLYPLLDGDTIDDILKAAGGITGNAEPNRLELIVLSKEGMNTPQKIDINRAEAWLLAALPGIGEVRAQAIIDYRQRNGLFRDINELLKVPGVGDTLFKNIRSLITVGD
jgi:competence protein ComEA